MTISKRKTALLTILITLVMVFSAFSVDVNAASNIKKVKPKFVVSKCYYANGKTCKAVLKWKKVSGAKKYIVYRATSKKGKYKKFATTKKLSIKKKSKGEYYYKVQAVKGKKKSKMSDPVHLFPAAGQIVRRIDSSMIFGGTKTAFWVIAKNDSKKTMSFPSKNSAYTICIVNMDSGKVVKEYAVNNVEDYMNGTPLQIAKGQDNISDVLVVSTGGTIQVGPNEEIVVKIKFKAGGKSFVLTCKGDSALSSTVAAIKK